MRAPHAMRAACDTTSDSGVVGCLQAMEAVKLAAGVGSVLSGKQCLYDGSDGTFRMLKLRPRDRRCAVCGDAPSIVTAAQSVMISSVSWYKVKPLQDAQQPLCL